MDESNSNYNQIFSNKEILFYMTEALNECKKALLSGEVPVGCVFVYLPTNKIILRGHNLTNKSKNATTHAEINCINSISEIFKNFVSKEDFISQNEINPKDAENLKKLFNNCALFVSCEPCIMCAYALNLIRKVFFGCENEKFGGNGSILSLHMGIGNCYESEGGYMKDEAIEVFKKFYIRGNEKAPDHKRQRKLLNDTD